MLLSSYVGSWTVPICGGYIVVLLQVRHVQDPPYGTGNQDASNGGVCYSEDLEYLQYDKDPLVRARINNDRAVLELEENYEYNR